MTARPSEEGKTSSNGLSTKPPPRRQRKMAGGAQLGQQRSPEARKHAAAILEVLAGARTPLQAAEALAVSLPRYYQLEQRGLEALLAACEPRPRGRGRRAGQEVVRLQKETERLQRELSRQQALVRLAQRNVGLSPVPPAGKQAARPAGQKKRRRRPVARALAGANRRRESGAEQTPPTAV
jgi:hypothetical protein